LWRIDVLKRALTFPSGFLWGTSTAGHQIEGNNCHSHWWEWEHQGLIRDGTKSGQAVDYWNRFEEDHDLMHELGYKAFRLSIEWARIEPEPGTFNEEAIEHYRSILTSLRKHGIQICLTLNHWVLPQWVALQNDWLNPKTIDDFIAFVEHVADQLGEFPYMWVTLNEPMMHAIAGYFLDEFPPQHGSLHAYRKVAHAMLRAHARAYHAIHRLCPTASDGQPARVGTAHAYPWIEAWGTPGWKGWYEKVAAHIARTGTFLAWDKSVESGLPHGLYTGPPIIGLRHSADYCGVNYYLRSSLRYDASKRGQFRLDERSIPPGVETSQMGWQIYPEGFYQTLHDVWRRFKKPIYVTENGIADDSDQQRPSYLLRHLAAMHRAIQAGVDVRGYFHWSFMDNFEWREGFACKFGLVAVDHSDPSLVRHPRPSAHLYGALIRHNAITEEIVEQYAPEAADEIFSNG
jgi:beta-glucosidase